MRGGTITRDRAIALLAAEPRRPIVSIIGPPGYGKTVLLGDWAARDKSSVAWLAVDDFDNDPNVFLTYLAAALDRIEPVDGSLRSALAAPGSRVVGAVVPRLAAELHRWPRLGSLVLDDLHRLVDPMCLDALVALMDHMPTGFRVLLAGRSAAGLPLARLRAQGLLLELGRNELALNIDEAQALVRALGRDLGAVEAQALVERTEGWAAAIYLASITPGWDGLAASAERGAMGRSGYIAEYLRLALEPELTPGDRTLLTRTSILEVVEPSLAEAVAQQANANERLHSLALRDHLIEELPGTAPSYRYHHLLRDFLRTELEQREPGAAAGLHRSAAAWYRDSKRPEPEVEHLLAAGDTAAAARLVTAVGLRLHYAGRSGWLDRWFRQFDDAIFESQPGLAALAAWIHALKGRSDAADRMADIVERSTFTGPAGDGASSFESSRAMLRAAFVRHGPEDALADATFAAAAEGAASPWRPVALMLLGTARMMTGDPGAADAAFLEGANVAKKAGMANWLELASRASIAIGRGDWAAADVLARESHGPHGHVGWDRLSSALLVHAVAARVALHHGDVRRAREEFAHAQIVLPHVSHTMPWVSMAGLLELAHAYMTLADPSGARAMLSEAEQILRRRRDLGVLAEDATTLRRRLETADRMPAGISSLTSAELRLLPLLSTHLTFEEIATRLSVSRHTVKAHSVSIYGKLGVSGRSEAIERAIGIGLLEPFPGLHLVARPARD